jgi:hypothetical protein
MPSAAPVPESERTELWHVAALTAILAAIPYAALRLHDRRVALWLVTLVLLSTFAVVAGHGITGYWRGLLIDSRNRLSLSRLQFAAWTVMILSALLAAVLANLTLGWEQPLDIQIPQELFILMGISTTSLVASPALLSSTRDRKPDPKAEGAGLLALQAQGYQDVYAGNTLVVANTVPSRARWADLLKGDEFGNAAVLDLSKVQMLIFTFVLVLAYGGAVAARFAGADGPVLALPEIQDGMNVLLGISHTGYLSTKAVSHTPEAAPQGTAAVVGAPVQQGASA